jgi:NADH-quinone oxidoreductase subunit F
MITKGPIKMNNQTDLALTKPLTKNIRPGMAPYNLQEYCARGGYKSVEKVIKTMAPADVTTFIKDSNLRGRGGAGFSTGFKLSAVPMGPNAPKVKYLVCNADEMEPGTFKDRLLMEGDPHLLIEGMIVAAYAMQASTAYIFIRGEYKLAHKLLNQAISEAYAGGFLGKNILGSGWNLEFHLHISAGRYICGEETALINALEGKRANPRAKPPFPQVSGLWGKPTLVQNVETLCNIPGIIVNGIDWYKGLGKGEDAGTKLYGVSGKVKNPGTWELPMGTTIREIFEGHAGGMMDGLKLRAFLPGGASTDFLTESILDTKMDFTSMGKIGTRMGTGTMIILDDKTCPIGMLHNLEYFFKQESCGWCTPCRDGLPWVTRILRGIERGEGRTGDIALLQSHAKWLGPGNTFCALAPGAASPLQSGLKIFAEDFQRHIHDKKCHYKH